MHSWPKVAYSSFCILYATWYFTIKLSIPPSVQPPKESIRPSNSTLTNHRPIGGTKRNRDYFNKKIKHSFCVLAFAKPKCNSVLQHIITRGLGKICYIVIVNTFLSSTSGLNGNEALCCHVLMGIKPAASDWSMISRIATC